MKIRWYVGRVSPEGVRISSVMTSPPLVAEIVTEEGLVYRGCRYFYRPPTIAEFKRVLEELHRQVLEVSKEPVKVVSPFEIIEL